jgi:flagellar L-ring protein precursor FlgH
MTKIRAFLWGLVFWVCFGGVALQSAHAGSLWREAVSDEKGMYSDKVARKVGDIVRIDGRSQAISLVPNALFNFNTTSTRTQEGGAPGMVGNLVSKLFGSATRGTRTDLKTILNAGTSGLGSPMQPNFEVQGQTGNTLQTQVQAFTFQMSAQVIDRLPNGNLVIEGVQTLGNSRDKVYITLRGIIRPIDIRADMTATPGNFLNTISVDKIADARIEIIPEGENSENARRGWLRRLDEKISPY